MSRCFPFPPPGYEKKARFEVTDLLTKEKHKEIKHKKDKRDKEKKKKDKERSKEKHSDKKDRKHKDKKDRDKDKNKNQTSDAKRTEGLPEFRIGDKVGPNSLQNNEISDSKYAQDLARRINDEDRATGSQIGQKIAVTDHRRGELPGRMVVHSIKNQLEDKERTKDKKKDDRKVNGQRNHIEVKSFGNTKFSGFSNLDQKRIQGIAKPVEKNDIRRQMEEKEKNKHKDRDPEKKSRSKDEKKDKEKKEEKAKEISETSKGQLKLKDSSPKLKDSGKGFLNSGNIRPVDVLKSSGNHLVGEGSLGKHKEPEINGISHDNGIRPSKLPRLVSSSHQVMENGRKLEPRHTAIHNASERQGAVPNHKVDVKEHKINGLTEVPKPIVCSSGPLSTVARVCENGATSVKPPHFDSNYLNQILSVPKVEDCSDLDDQEWLFSNDSQRSKKLKVGFPEVDGTEQVWEKALRIESADVTALPYVIPF